MMGYLFPLHTVTIVGYFLLLLLLKLLHVWVVRPSSGRNILAKISRLTTDLLFEGRPSIWSYAKNKFRENA
jgi:hypothetical protein